MGHIKEPNGVTLLVDKQILTSDMEKRIKDFIKKSKEKNKKLLDKLKIEENRM
jgi:hypothetical protein